MLSIADINNFSKLSNFFESIPPVLCFFHVSIADEILATVSAQTDIGWHHAFISIEFVGTVGEILKTKGVIT